MYINECSHMNPYKSQCRLRSHDGTYIANSRRNRAKTCDLVSHIYLFLAWKCLQQGKKLIRESSEGVSKHEKTTRRRIEDDKLLRHTLKIRVNKSFVLIQRVW